MGLRGTSRSRAPWGRVDQWPGPHDLRLSFGDTVRFALPVGPLRRTWPAGWPAVARFAGPGLLSWGCHRSAPPSASIPGVHSQWSRCSEELPRCASPRRCTVRRGATFGPELPHSGLVPPLPFLPAATVCSTKHFSGLLHPETDHGVRQVAGLVGPDPVHLSLPVRGKPRPVDVPFLRPPKGNPARRRRRGRCSRIRGCGRWLPLRRGGQEASSNHSRWRSTLRSFSLAFSRPASTASPFRTPAFPVASANRVLGGSRRVGRSGLAGHRGPCLLAVGPG